MEYLHTQNDAMKFQYIDNINLREFVNFGGSTT